MKKNLLFPFLLVFAAILFHSCARDVDFEQASEVTLRPVVELNLIFFDLEADRFVDSLTGQVNRSVRDTTEIRFLDDSGTQESLVRLDFLFQFLNSIDHSFDVDFQFITEENDTAYAFSTTVGAGSVDSPVATDLLQVGEGEDISLLTTANRLVVAVNIDTVDPVLEGLLNLRSKTTYFFEIRERE